MHGWAHYRGNNVTWCAPEVWLWVLKKRTQHLAAMLKLLFDTMKGVTWHSYIYRNCPCVLHNNYSISSCWAPCLRNAVPCLFCFLFLPSSCAESTYTRYLEIHIIYDTSPYKLSEMSFELRTLRVHNNIFTIILICLIFRRS